MSLRAAPAFAADDAADERYVDLGVRISPVLFAPAYMVGTGHAIGVEAAYRLTPAWRVGAYAQAVLLYSTSSDSREYDEQLTDASRYGARAEWHLLPDGTWDPWIGASAGVFHARRGEAGSDSPEAGVGNGVDVGADFGLDIHLGFFSIGPLVYIVEPITNRELFGSRGYYSLIPSLRSGVSF